MNTRETFGHMPDGAGVERVTIRGGGLTANILTYGSVLQDLRLDGHAPSLVLGFNDLGSYLEHSRYFGATAGRCANRIGGAAFSLNGTDYRLDANFLGKHHLHGGSRGVGKRSWAFTEVSTSAAELSIALQDGEMGYPGSMTVTVRYSLLPGGVLDVAFAARTDRPTLCNLAHHSYFNLDGGDTILDHDLRIDADAYLPVDGELIPTGEVRAVEGTPFDFRTPRPIRQVSGQGVLDHNFCLSDRRGALRTVGRLSSRRSGVAMDIRTTEPGLQVYDGGGTTAPVPGLDGRVMCAHAGVAIEPQVWPDAIHNPAFPQAVLNPGEAYRQQTQFVFTRGNP